MIDASFNKSKRGIYPTLLVLNHNNNDGDMYRLPPLFDEYIISKEEEAIHNIS
jgi:hypothetical protein